jgi:hypothetical protein
VEIVLSAQRFCSLKSIPRLMEDGFLHAKEYDVIDSVNKLIGWNPDKIKVCYERIQKRNRQGENIPSIHYLESLHQKHLDMTI